MATRKSFFVCGVCMPDSPSGGGGVRRPRLSRGLPRRPGVPFPALGRGVAPAVPAVCRPSAGASGRGVPTALRLSPATGAGRSWRGRGVEKIIPPVGGASGQPSVRSPDKRNAPRESAFRLSGRRRGHVLRRPFLFPSPGQGLPPSPLPPRFTPCLSVAGARGDHPPGGVRGSAPFCIFIFLFTSLLFPVLTVRPPWPRSP